ncbi:hypothetical protein, partial [Variovorax sp. WDL1]
MEHHVPLRIAAAPEDGTVQRASYWQQLFPPSDLAVTELPIDRARTAQSIFAPALASLDLDAEACASANRLAEAAGRPLEAVFFCVFAGMVHWLAQQPDLLVG